MTGVTVADLTLSHTISNTNCQRGAHSRYLSRLDDPETSETFPSKTAYTLFLGSRPSENIFLPLIRMKDLRAGFESRSECRDKVRKDVRT